MEIFSKSCANSTALFSQVNWAPTCDHITDPLVHLWWHNFTVILEHCTNRVVTAPEYMGDDGGSYWLTHTAAKFYLHCSWQRSTDTVQTPTLSTRASASWCFELILDFVLYRFKSSLVVAQTSADTFTQTEMESQGDTMHCMFNSQSSGSQTLSSSSFSSSPGAKSSNKRWTHRCSWIEI